MHTDPFPKGSQEAKQIAEAAAKELIASREQLASAIADYLLPLPHDAKLKTKSGHTISVSVETRFTGRGGATCTLKTPRRWVYIEEKSPSYRKWVLFDVLGWGNCDPAPAPILREIAAELPEALSNWASQAKSEATSSLAAATRTKQATKA